jgi:hypothetical protein
MRDNQKASDALMKEILRDSYLELTIEKHTLEEDIAAGQSQIRAIVIPSGERPDMPRRTIEGKGVGMVDAFFRGLIDQLSPEYPSLKTIRFVGFSVKGILDKSGPKGVAGSDAVGEVRLMVENSEDNEFEFTSKSRSITAASLQATLEAVEYFVNSERAFLMTHHALKDAETRGRHDLVQMFGRRLAELVQNTSYSDAIEAAKKSAGAKRP